MTARSPTRTDRTEAKAYIHRVQTDQQANTSRRRRSGGKDVKHCLFTLLSTQSQPKAKQNVSDDRGENV